MRTMASFMCKTLTLFFICMALQESRGLPLSERAELPAQAPRVRTKRCSCNSWDDKECIYFCHLDIIWVNTPSSFLMAWEVPRLAAGAVQLSDANASTRPMKPAPASAVKAQRTQGRMSRAHRWSLHAQMATHCWSLSDLWSSPTPRSQKRFRHQTRTRVEQTGLAAERGGRGLEPTSKKRFNLRGFNLRGFNLRGFNLLGSPEASSSYLQRQHPGQESYQLWEHEGWKGWKAKKKAADQAFDQQKQSFRGLAAHGDRSPTARTKLGGVV